MKELTLCSVYHTDMTKQILELNWDHTRKLNPYTDFQWLACDNSPKTAPIKIDSKKFIIVPGITVPDYVPQGSRSGFYMGLAINEMIKRVDTRFMAILDYDVFISRPDWINDVLNHMKKNDLAIMGIPFHPKYWAKTRYFPSSHCIIADLGKFSREEILSWDCAPQYSREELKHSVESANYKRQRKAIESKKPKKHFIKYLTKIFHGNIQKRKYIGLGKDVCYDFYRRYYGKIKYECVQPVAVKRDFVRHYFLPGKFDALMEFIERYLPIPDRRSFVPRRKNYFTYTRFRDIGYYDVLSLGLEEYLWLGEPFAFHMRGYHSIRKNFNPDDQINLMKDISRHFEP